MASNLRSKRFWELTWTRTPVFSTGTAKAITAAITMQMATMTIKGVIPLYVSLGLILIGNYRVEYVAEDPDQGVTKQDQIFPPRLP